jgi:pyruvate dehydrogenase (quinone)
VLSADRPALIEVMVDPNISMLPAHVTREQAVSFGKAMLKGDPDAAPTIVQSVKGVLAGILPTHKGDEVH